MTVRRASLYLLITLSCAVQRAAAQEPAWRPTFRDTTTFIRGFGGADSSNFMMPCWRAQEQYVLRSLDGGRTWNRVFTDSARIVDGRKKYPPQLWGFAYPSSNVAIATGDTGYVLRTSDAGATWQSLRLGTRRIELLAMRDESHGVVVRLGNPNFLMATSDGGQSWDSVNSPRPPVGAMYAISGIGIAAPETYFALWQRSDSTTLAVTTDRGATWEYFPNPFGYRVDRAVFDFLDAERGWVAVARRVPDDRFERTSVFATTNGGREWTMVFDSTVGNGSGPTDIKFADAMNGIVAGPNQIFRTTDGGRRWTYEADGRSDGELSWYYIAYPTITKALIALTFGTILEPTARNSIVELGNTAESRAVVAPNPVARGASIRIRVPDGARPIDRAEIVAPLGQIVEQRRYDEAETAELATVGIAAGAYFIRLTDSDGKTVVVPVVIADR